MEMELLVMLGNAARSWILQDQTVGWGDKGLNTVTCWDTQSRCSANSRKQVECNSQRPEAEPHISGPL